MCPNNDLHDIRSNIKSYDGNIVTAEVRSYYMERHFIKQLNAKLKKDLQQSAFGSDVLGKEKVCPSKWNKREYQSDGLWINN